MQQPQSSAPEEVRESNIIGVATPRIDGAVKTTGTAMYASDHHFEGLVYAWPTTATVASGHVENIDTAAAEKMPGVLAVYTHETLDRLYRMPPRGGMLAENRPPLEDKVISYYGQYVAVAVAETVEQARAAAEAVKVKYIRTPHNVDDRLLDQSSDPLAKRTVTKRGDVDTAFAQAPVKHDAVYGMATETHNPMELHASVAVFKDKKFTLYETTQAVVNQRDVLAVMLGVPKENVQVLSPFLGSGFGGKSTPWAHSLLAAACARNLNRPVKLVISRSMAFESVGHRPAIEQRIRLAAESNGRLTVVAHDYVNHTSMLDHYDEGCGEATGFLYSTPNLIVTGATARRNVGAPTWMRGPGAVPGLYALEAGMDELAVKLKMDPVQLRLLNEPEIDETNGLPFSSRNLKECLTVGAEKFGWSRRNPAIGSMKNADGTIIGWGVAAASWGAMRAGAEAGVELRQDGTARVTCATQDIGTGTYTIMAQLVSHETGIPVQKIDVALGDSALPPGPVSGGSMVTATIVPAVLLAAKDASQSLLNVAHGLAEGPFTNCKPADLEMADGFVRIKATPSTRMSLADVLQRARLQSVRGHGKSASIWESGIKASFHSFGAQFVEVTWMPEIARLRVSRVVSVLDVGRVLNPTTARSQIEGAVVMGVGMALLEATEYDQRSGAPINANFADYVVPVHADCPKMDVVFLDKPDFKLNPTGSRGLGEIGLAGVAPAITAAIYHATGIRARNLPVRIEDLLGPATTQSVA